MYRQYAQPLLLVIAVGVISAGSIGFMLWQTAPESRVTAPVAVEPAAPSPLATPRPTLDLHPSLPPLLEQVVNPSSPTPTPGTATTFAVIGDYGGFHEGTASSEAAVATLVKSWQPEFVITVGDNNYPRGEAATIDGNIGQFYADYIGDYTGAYGGGASQNNFFPTLGNHDWDSTTGADPYLRYFTLPGNERYYDFKRGPVHFFALDSDTREPDGITATSKQGQWLKETMQQSTSPWQVVYMHHAPYSSSSNHGSSTPMQWPYKEWGADLVLAGHDHTYERLMIDGIPYVVNGVGGKAIYQFGPAIAGSEIRYNKSYGAMLVTATDQELSWEFRATDDNTIDQHTLRR